MITVKDLEHIASLSRIKLLEEDKSSLLREFNSILGYIDELKKAKVGTETEGRIGSVKNVMRPDEASPISESDREALLAEVPHREGDYVAVKKIIAQD